MYALAFLDVDGLPHRRPDEWPWESYGAIDFEDQMSDWYNIDWPARWMEV